MKVTVQGQGDVTLTQRHFVAAGGEGQIFAHGGTAYKIYHDPAKMLPVGKIAELAVLTHPNISKPDRVLFDPRSQRAIGYTTRFITDAVPLCQVLTRAFREREGLDHPKMLELVRRLQAIVEHVHNAGLLIVDLNEMNFLVDKALADIFAIDVDSYQTPHYPATALMPSVRDWKTPLGDFNTGSDWFSFACVAFQMFTGIHPYKGRHPSVQGFEERMKAGISVFDSSVSVPKVVYSFDVIPPAYRSWFKAVLQEGRREAPPNNIGTAAVAAVLARQIGNGGAVLDITELLESSHPILGFVNHGQKTVVWTARGVYVNNHRIADTPPNLKGVGFSPKMDRPVFASIQHGNLVLSEGTRTIPIALRADDAMAYDGRIYVRSRDSILEIVLTDTPNSVVASTRLAADVLEHATRLYDGVAVQNLLGSVFVSMFPRTGATYQTRMAELDQYRIVDARYDHRVLMVVAANKQGRYDRLVFHFSEDHSTYQALPAVRDITPTGVNFVTLDNGVCVHLTEDDRLEISAVGTSKVREVTSPVLGNDMRLVRHEGRVAFVRGEKAYSLRLK